MIFVGCIVSVKKILQRHSPLIDFGNGRVKILKLAGHNAEHPDEVLCEFVTGKNTGVEVMIPKQFLNQRYLCAK